MGPDSEEKSFVFHQILKTFYSISWSNKCQHQCPRGLFKKILDYLLNMMPTSQHSKLSLVMVCSSDLEVSPCQSSCTCSRCFLRPSMSLDDDHTDIVCALIYENSDLTVREVAEEISTSFLLLCSSLKHQNQSFPRKYGCSSQIFSITIKLFLQGAGIRLSPFA